MSQSEISPLEAEELRFEYEQRRKELLQNDTLIPQILIATVLLTSTILTFAISNEISYTLKGVVCFIAWLIALIGIYQIIDREQSIFITASYLRRFVESETKHMKWDTRLVEFRKYQKTHKKRQGFSLSLNLLRTLSLILVGSFSLGAIYVLLDVFQGFPLPYLSVPLLILWLACTAIPLWRLWRSPNGYDRYGIRDLTYFDETWEAVEKKEEEEKKKGQVTISQKVQPN